MDTDSLTKHVVVLDRAQPTAWRAHHEVVSKAPSPEQRQQVAVLQAFAATLPTDSPALPGVIDAIRTATEERVEFVAPLEVTEADLNHLGDGRFEEAPYACGCGKPLTSKLDKLTAVWAKHVATEAGVDQAIALDHPLRNIAGSRPAAYCGCGHVFPARDESSTNPDDAVDAWAEHVRVQE